MDTVIRVKATLKALGLTESSRQLEQVMEAARQSDWTPLVTLEQLLDKEQKHRQDIGKTRRLKAARLPFYKTLADFDYGFQPGVSQRQMKQLAEMAWLGEAYNILFLGPPGVGKTHLAVALGMAAIEAGYRVYFTTLDQLIANLTTEAISTRSQQQLRALNRAQLVILDEVGFLPINRQEANLLFQLVAKLYQQTSIILTSNKGFAEWGEFLGDQVITSAILDRLMHKCELFNLEGDSYRISHRQTILG